VAQVVLAVAALVIAVLVTIRGVRWVFEVVEGRSERRAAFADYCAQEDSRADGCGFDGSTMFDTISAVQSWQAGDVAYAANTDAIFEADDSGVSYTALDRDGIWNTYNSDG
jgi:hypothetical protein